MGCAAKNDPKRFELKACNENACIGDEVCQSQIDLIIALDGSGSVTQAGFDVFKTFAAMIVRRLKAQAYGQEAMKVAVVQFGNGKLDSNNIVSDAKVVATSSNDMETTAL